MLLTRNTIFLKLEIYTISFKDNIIFFSVTTSDKSIKEKGKIVTY